MKILLTNDDGYFSKGIVMLDEMLSEVGDVTIVAPENNHSGASSSLTLKNPLRSEERRVGKECRSRWSPYH